MTSPEDRRTKIVDRQAAGGFSVFDIVQESGYQGYKHYADGNVDAGDAKIYAVEQALDRLEQNAAG
jgi:hypothetical protein